MATNEEVLTPKWIVIPNGTKQNCPTCSGASMVGSLMMSGSKLYVFTNITIDGWELVTSG